MKTIMEDAFSRVGGSTQYGALVDGEFKPFLPSKEVQQAFEDNAEKLGLTNPYEEASEIIEQVFLMNFLVLI